MSKWKQLPWALALALAAGTVMAKDAAPADEALQSPIRGIQLDNFDKSAQACTDFFQYSNGNWLLKNPIPGDQSAWGTFDVLGEYNTEQLHRIMQSASAAKAKAGTPEQQVGDFFATAMDEATIESLGLKPIEARLADIAGIESGADVLSYLQRAHREGRGQLFNLYISANYQNSDEQYLFVTQGGLGLPDRDFYTRSDADSTKLQEAYRGHIAKLLSLAGSAEDEAKAAAERIYALEKRLAEKHITREERRNPANQYQPIKLDEANKLTDQIDWSAYFKALALGAEVQEFSLNARPFFAEINTLLKELPAAQWQEYFRWHTLRSAASYLPKAFADADFAFYSGVLRGAKEQRPRWRRMVELTSGALGQPTGKLYVAEYFPPEAKAKMMELIGDLKSALKVRLEALEWMGDDTRKEALAKFAAFNAKIGYPDQWRDYSGLVIERGELIGNLQRVAAFEAAYNFAKYGKPTDRNEWGMSPQTINAYYSPLNNEIVFPAGILQPPFFDLEADRAVNYGAIGGVIGHELLHGYDDQGSQFDAKGRNRNWWTAEDRSRFTERTDRLVNQYNNYMLEGLNLNGRVSLGENIADLGGVTIAYDALQAALKREPQEPIDGLTAEQRFFLAWSQVWRRALRPEQAKLQINTGPHSPAKFRVIGPLSNIPAFAEAFGCESGDAMVREGEQRVAIW